MATKIDELINQLEVKLDILSKRYVDLQKYQQMATALKEENTLLKQQYETLKTAKTLALSERDVQQTRVQLSRLIRQIDTCISLLVVEK
ncbi:MAG: hypothetical protein IJ832_02100 [Bacteroidaceae bacterium]|nr:hypothetical protein [Bacteroidaceae bacterium]